MYGIVAGLVLALAPVGSEPPEQRYLLVRTSVVDGDTLRGDVELPLDVTLRHQRVRVLGVDAWETRGPEREKGEAAKAFTIDLAASGTIWIAPTGKRPRDNFGRVLAEVWIHDGTRWHNLAAELIENGHGIARSDR